MDGDRFVGLLPAGRGDAHKLLSIAGDAHAEAGHHLLSFGYLLLDEEPLVGKGGQKLGDPCLKPSRPGCWPGSRGVWLTKSGASISSNAPRSALPCSASKKRRTNVLLCSADIEVPPCELLAFLRGMAPCMMPLEISRRTCR